MHESVNRSHQRQQLLVLPRPWAQLGALHGTEGDDEVGQHLAQHAADSDFARVHLDEHIRQLGAKRLDLAVAQSVHDVRGHGDGLPREALHIPRHPVERLGVHKRPKLQVCTGA